MFLSNGNKIKLTKVFFLQTYFMLVRSTKQSVL